MAFVTPLLGKNNELAARMRAFRDILKTKHGFLNGALLSERGGTTLVGMSIWIDEASYEKAMASIQGPRSQGPAEELREAPPLLRRFTEI